MDAKEIFSHIDHTLLKPTATTEEIRQLCREAEEYGAASVCIPPCFVEQVRKDFPGLRIGTVVGFPLGYITTEMKIFEATTLVVAGADEIDMVINQGWVREKNYYAAAIEIAKIKQSVGDCVLKAIIETCNMSKEDLLTIAMLFGESGADYLKTSTGFGKAGAQITDVALLRALLPEKVKLKAAGGIRTKEQMEGFLAMGCDRLGCSTGMSLFAKESAEAE
ncbi:MAG: deoxyribose-phosphate aldolase [Firmicutes bacterium]|nr:deoxyribose-phosphate aldolase [Bacillota bacterium]